MNNWDIEVADLVDQGYTPIEISKKLGISKKEDYNTYQRLYYMINRYKKFKKSNSDTNFIIKD